MRLFLLLPFALFPAFALAQPPLLDEGDILVEEAPEPEGRTLDEVLDELPPERATQRVGEDAPIHASDISAPGAPSLEPVLEAQEKMGIPYATGGVGKEEVAALKAIEPQFNLRILSSMAGGAYVFGTEVAIFDSAGGLVFEGELSGPYLYVRLAPGEYRVDAKQGQKAQSKKVRVKNEGLTPLNFGW